MDGAWFAAGVGAAPVVQAEGEIALLLDFGKDDAWSDGMHSAGRDKDAVTSVNFVNVQQIFQITATQSLLKPLGCHTRLQTAADSSARFCMQNDPRFRLAVFDGVERFGLLVVGMNLK